MPFNFRHAFEFFYYSFFKAENTPARLSWKRVLFLCVIFLLYPFWHLYLRFGYYLDEIFFPGYRQQTIDAPIFIVGNFRSGTTFLHHLLLRDQDATALKTWEIYFAPSILYRKVFRAVIKVSRMIGSPVRWLVKQINKPIESYMYMHETGIDKIEEDSHIFYHVWASYNLFALFPFPELAERYIYYDQKISPQQKEQDFGYYRDILRRHIYLNGGKRYISKNPDFSPAVKTIQEFFPDAKFINIVRDPAEVVPSTINMWATHWHTFGSPREAYPLKETLIEHAKHWYVYPHEQLRSLPEDRYVVIDFDTFVRNPKKVVEDVYEAFGMQISPHYARVLEEETIRSRHYQSDHTYSLEEMGLDEALIHREFDHLLERYTQKDPMLEVTSKVV
jgi:hypothetical protein